MTHNNPQEYIFCPFCGSIKWITDKTGSSGKGQRLSYHKCSGCKKFTYTNVTVLIDHPILVGVTHTQRYSVEAEIGNYKITVFYYDKSMTEFVDLDKREVVLTINSPISFNWYKNDELISKIKTYVVFS